MMRKWRPSLWFVLGGAMAGTLALSLAGLVAFRYLGPALGYGEAAILLGLVIALLTAALWIILLRLLQRPITGLAAYAAAIRATPDATVPPPDHFGTRELHRMAMSVIDMAATLANREATIRSFTDHVTHELKTPVTAIRAAAELLDDDPDLAPGNRALVRQLVGASEQMNRQLEALRQVAAAREMTRGGDCRLETLVDSLKAAHGTLAISLHGGDLSLPIAPEVMRILLGHLAGNAAAHGATRLDILCRDDETGRVVRVIDDGNGVSDGNRPHVFEPFFTTRREDGGTGMGLYIVARLLKSHGGAIVLEEAANGAAFRLSFP
jgi:two-component system, OmpR family, sensor kinase